MSFNFPDCFICRDTGITQQFHPEYLGIDIHKEYTPTGDECPVCNNHTFDTDKQRNPVCPYCGNTLADWAEDFNNPNCEDGTEQCPHCHHIFTYEVTRLWTTNKTT